MQFNRPIVLAGLSVFALLIAGYILFIPKGEKPAAPSAPQTGQVEQVWKESTLSPETIAKANAAVLDYRQCLARETSAKAGGKGDSRSIANTILKACEDRLLPIKAAYDTEQVPAALSERYMRKTRSQGVQSVMLAVQAAQAQRAVAAEEAKQ